MYKEPEKKQEKYVGFPMKMNAYGHKELFIVQKDENAFILYFILGKMTQNYWTWGSFETTVVTLSKQFSIKKKESDNRKEIKRLLLVLHEKGWFKIMFDEQSFEYDTLLNISMVDLDSPQVMSVVESENFKHTGYLKVTQEMFDSCKWNARHFRGLIYAEWRMMRGQENEGKYRISGSEWQKAMGISKLTQINLVKELDELNLVDKQRGEMYIDACGKPKRETNLYSVVCDEERQERKQEEKQNEYSLIKQHNFDVHAEVAQLDAIDPRCENTNVYKTGKKDYLGNKEYWIWNTTKYKSTKMHLDARFNSFKNARPDLYATVVMEGEKYMKKINANKDWQEKQHQMSSHRNKGYDPRFYLS
ncbi:hypothetical protein BBD42_21535 [Paenibacillus sp. BIHB 4019]|uniref:Uncharacterized protein n=1 Tax=Paenibacillus sp. BIHB 4019 TaxID=1870819 RepID=A0A1B2DM32_9BACL|nr:hypothetical protein [Paenibacillus sp. BIHB 4019]ANY68759.1 hypothetical protein BBD42_21535 [Paenibacillus sp. BIHB 4019]